MLREIIDFELTDANSLERAADRYGLLPFFYCGMPGFSVEELTPSRYWFAGDVDGPWEWRMEVARRGSVAYGKLFAGKAGFCSQEYYPDLANYRRDGYDFDARWEDGLANYRDKQIMDALAQNGPCSRANCGAPPASRRALKPALPGCRCRLISRSAALNIRATSTGSHTAGDWRATP